jgi:hypothetical protein
MVVREAPVTRRLPVASTRKPGCRAELLGGRWFPDGNIVIHGTQEYGLLDGTHLKRTPMPQAGPGQGFNPTFEMVLKSKPTRVAGG